MVTPVLEINGHQIAQSWPDDLKRINGPANALKSSYYRNSYHSIKTLKCYFFLDGVLLLVTDSFREIDTIVHGDLPRCKRCGNLCATEKDAYNHQNFHYGDSYVPTPNLKIDSYLTDDQARTFINQYYQNHGYWFENIK